MLWVSLIPSSSMGSIICSLWLSFWLTCCTAWPTPYRRSYQYFPPLMTELGPPNQWDIAQEPLSYDQPEDYYDNSQWADVEALSNLIEMYDNSPPVWGQIVREKPEEELQELKRSSPPLGAKPKHQQQKQQRVPISIDRVVTTSPPVSSLSYSPSPSAVPSVTNKVQQPQQVNRFSAQSSSVEGGLNVGGGQKEVALLRPPTKSKSRVHNPSQSSSSASSSSMGSGIDTGIIAASERQKKPSAYDTLRKYLTLEDALKKEQEKRRVGRPQQKRSNFVAEEASLTGQLSNLNKSMA